MDFSKEYLNMVAKAKEIQAIRPILHPLDVWMLKDALKVDSPALGREIMVIGHDQAVIDRKGHVEVVWIPNLVQSLSLVCSFSHVINKSKVRDLLDPEVKEEVSILANERLKTDDMLDSDIEELTQLGKYKFIARNGDSNYATDELIMLHYIMNLYCGKAWHVDSEDEDNGEWLDMPIEQYSELMALLADLDEDESYYFLRYNYLCGTKHGEVDIVLKKDHPFEYMKELKLLFPAYALTIANFHEISKDEYVLGKDYMTGVDYTDFPFYSEED